MHNYCYLHFYIKPPPPSFSEPWTFQREEDWNDCFLPDIFILVRSNPRLCHASFRLQPVHFSRVFHAFLSLPSSRICTDTGHSRSLDYLLCPGSYSTECVSCSNPFSFYTIPLLSVCYSKSEWVCKVGGYHHAAQGSTSLIQFTCLYSFRDTRVIFTALFL